MTETGSNVYEHSTSKDAEPVSTVMSVRRHLGAKGAGG